MNNYTTIAETLPLPTSRQQAEISDLLSESIVTADQSLFLRGESVELAVSVWPSEERDNSFDVLLSAFTPGAGRLRLGGVAVAASGQTADGAVYLPRDGRLTSTGDLAFDDLVAGAEYRLSPVRKPAIRVVDGGKPSPSPVRRPWIVIGTARKDEEMDLAAASAGISPVHELVRLMAALDPGMDRRASRAVRTRGGAAATEPFLARLADMLRDADADVRAAAAEAVGRLGATEATQPLLARLAELLEQTPGERGEEITVLPVDRPLIVPSADGKLVGTLWRTARVTLVLAVETRDPRLADAVVRMALVQQSGEVVHQTEVRLQPREDEDGIWAGHREDPVSSAEPCEFVFELLDPESDPS